MIIGGCANCVIGQKVGKIVTISPPFEEAYDEQCWYCEWEDYSYMSLGIKGGVNFSNFNKPSLV